VLETEEEARERGARCHARLADWSLVSHQTDNDRANTCAAALNHLVERRVARAETMPGAIIAAGNGDPTWEQSEAAALSAAGLTSPRILFPKKQAGDSFAAAAPLQIALGALLAHELRKPVLANCFGHGSEQAAFLLEQP
jgi:3-oxoacyl-(acyl-carrier-protein) synthase